MERSEMCQRCGGNIVYEGLYDEKFCLQCSYRPDGHSLVDIRLVSSTLDRNLGAVTNGMTSRHRVSQ